MSLTAYLDEDGPVLNGSTCPALYVEPAPGGALVVIGRDGIVDTAYRLPEHVVELWTFTEALKVVREALTGVKLSKVARAAVDAALGALDNEPSEQESARTSSGYGTGT